jgi:hypothetical protein
MSARWYPSVDACASVECPARSSELVRAVASAERIASPRAVPSARRQTSSRLGMRMAGPTLANFGLIWYSRARETT